MIKTNYSSKIIVIVIVAILLSGCKSNLDKVEWRFLDNQENNSRTTIIVEDVLYREFQYIYWKPSEWTNYEEIEKSLFYNPEDAERVFLYYDKSFGENEEMYFIKDGIELPRFVQENVSLVIFKFPPYHEISEKIYYVEYRNDKMIKKIFTLMEQKEFVDSAFYNRQNKMHHIGELLFYNDDLKGIEVSRGLYVINNNYWIDANEDSYYAEISKEFLSQISGISLPEAEDFDKLTNVEKYDLFGLEFG